MASAVERRSAVGATVCKFAMALFMIASAALPASSSVAAAVMEQSAERFVKASGPMFTVGGQPFFVTGVNNHYLTSGTKAEVIRVLDDAQALGANVVRTYLQPVVGSLDGSVATIWNWRSDAESSNLGVNGTYLLYWDDAAGAMAINDGPDGMGNVDFLIAEAKKRHLRLIIAFLDFWSYTGGAQQMRAWYGSASKDGFFFSDPRSRADYRAWVSHVLIRANPLTGLRYRDDPTIFAWELMNEGNARPDALRMSWTADMAEFVKSVDPNHLVSSGHANVDSRLADLAIPGIDFGTWHGYPAFYKLSVEHFDRLIGEFCGIAAARQKPVLLEEFGYARSNPDQADAYREWLNTLSGDRNCAGWLVWRLVSRQESGKYPVDEHDQFDVRNDDSPLWNVLKTAIAKAASRSGTNRQALGEAPVIIGKHP